MTYDGSMGWTSARVAPGTRLNGIFEVDVQIGSGGMGEIYKGHAIQTGDAVAIKVIRPDLAENSAALALFRKEASILHNLAHDAIVRYYVFSVAPEIGRPYLAMEFVDGQPLSEILQNGPLKFDQVRSLQRRLAAGLQAAHELGVVHRDISPDNIILPGGEVNKAKIIDFGIARSAAIGGGTIIGGGFAGKYSYVSPEQLGLYGGEVTAQSDIYSLGLVLAESITGKPVDMGGTQVEVIDKRRRVPKLEGVDGRIRPLLEKMLQPRPEDRPASMSDVAEWQGSRLLGRRGGSGQGGGGRNYERGRRTSRPALVAFGSLAAVAAAGAIAFYALNPWRPEGLSDTIPEVATAPPPETAPPALTPTDGEGGAAEAVTVPALGPEVASVPATAASPAPPEAPAVTAEPDAAQPPAAEVPAETAAPVPAEPAGEVEVAMLPTAGAAGVAQYIRDYRGGECLFLEPIAVGEGSASIEAFSVSLDPVQRLDQKFKADNGFEANIELRQVTQPQCPATIFLRHVEKSPNPPALAIRDDILKTGDNLAGQVAGLAGRNLTMLLVSDDGLVYNLSDAVAPNADPAAFDLRVDSGAVDTEATPQLLLALATAKPIQGLPAATAPTPAAELFPELSRALEAAGEEVGVTMGYFRMEP